MLRLSNHFLLLDFLYDQSTIDCVVHCGDKLLERVSSIKDDQEVLVEGRHLCETILEPIVKQHGPISIAAGLWFRDLPGQGKAHDTRLAPHEWKKKTGAAADIVVHSWVNDERNPKDFLATLSDKNIKYHRAIPYPGSEFCCVGAQSNDSKGAPPKRQGRPGAWRRKPYTHSHGKKLRHDVGYESRMRCAESSWLEDIMTGSDSAFGRSKVYGREWPKRLSPLDHSIVEVPEDAFDDHPAGGRQLVRPWHVRVSESFVLLDFCRNEEMFVKGMVTVPPLTFRMADTVIKVARMFGEVLDQVKRHLGNISVVRGMEPKEFSKDPGADEHRWIPGEGRIHSIEFITPRDPEPDYRRLLHKNEHVYAVHVSPDPIYGGDRVRVSIRDFTPESCYTSATGEEYAWTDRVGAGP